MAGSGEAETVADGRASSCEAEAVADGRASAGEAGAVADGRASAVEQRAWVYLLRCGDGSLYTGWTVDLQRRLALHSAGRGSRYTRSRLPVELALALPMADRSAARREEARIKRLDRRAKLALLAGEAQRTAGRAPFAVD